MSNVNTTQSIKKNPAVSATLNDQLKKAQKTFKEAKQVEVNIPALYIQRLGSHIPVCINEVCVNVPVGEKVKIPEPFADILQESLDSLGEEERIKRKAQRKLSNPELKK